QHETQLRLQGVPRLVDRLSVVTQVRIATTAGIDVSPLTQSDAELVDGRVLRRVARELRDVTDDEVLGLVVLLRRPDLMPLIEDRLHAGRVDARLRRPVAQDPGDVLIGHPPSAEHRVDRLRVLLGGRIRVLIAVVMSPPLTLTDVIGPTGIEVTDVLTQCLSLDLTMD